MKLSKADASKGATAELQTLHAELDQARADAVCSEMPNRPSDLWCKDEIVLASTKRVLAPPMCDMRRQTVAKICKAVSHPGYHIGRAMHGALPVLHLRSQ